MSGFRFDKNLQTEFADLKNNNEFNETIIKNYKFIRSEEYFSNSVRRLLAEVELDLNDKVNIVAQNDLKCEFIALNIQKLMELVEKVELISKEYPKIDLEKIQEKARLFLTTINIQNINNSEIITYDDLLNDFTSLIKQISLVNFPKSFVNEFFDINNSNIYMSCLYKSSIEVTNTIQSIISQNSQILNPNFVITAESPFLIPIEIEKPIEKPTELLIKITNEITNEITIEMPSEKMTEMPKEKSKDIPVKPKSEFLKEQLNKYGFFELEKVKTLTEQNQILLIKNISEKKLPYAIAMFDYLKFIAYLDSEHFNSAFKRNLEISKWFEGDADGRSVRGNINSLLSYTNEDKKKYTAHLHKENVEKDYELLK
jgi:hypothetical protein